MAKQNEVRLTFEVDKKTMEVTNIVGSAHYNPPFVPIVIDHPYKLKIAQSQVGLSEQGGKNPLLNLVHPEIEITDKLTNEQLQKRFQFDDERVFLPSEEPELEQ